MRTPKFIYESLPYCYFMVSLGLIFTADNTLFYCSAALFYFAGAITWTSRSNARRLNSPNKFATSFFNVRINDSLYELMPFIHFAVGITLLLIFSDEIVAFLSICLCIYALQNLLSRVFYRRKRQTELSFGKRRANKKNSNK